jgi:integrase
MVAKPLADEAYQALLRHRARQDQEKAAAGGTWRAHGLVFCREDGSPETQNRARSQFGIALRAAGLAEIPPKNLRHSFATNSRAAGNDLDLTASITGHRRITTLAEPYVQPVTRMQHDAVGKLEGLVQRARRAREPEPGGR